MKKTENRQPKQFFYILAAAFLLLQFLNTGLVFFATEQKTENKPCEISVLQKDNASYANEQKIEFADLPVTLAVWQENDKAEPEKTCETKVFSVDKNQVLSGCSEILLYNVQDDVCEEYDLEEYVTCTLLAEMPTSYDIEALKAQAVACRTYAVYKLLSGVNHNNGANLCTSPAHCQAFISSETVTPERYEIARNAVKETENIIMFYDGQPILAVFHASCGQKTNSSAEVWGGERSYLQSVNTFESLNPDMETVKTYTFAKNEFLSKLKKAGFEISDVTNVYTTRNPSGKTSGLYVSGVFIKGETAANALNLRSCDYDASYNPQDDVLTFTVYGYGHGVGMSQKGAQDLAQRGYLFHEILGHYYTGITFGYVN